MGAIFISYRRADTEGQAGRLFKDLCERFGKDSVLIDVAGMEKGRDFRHTIERRLDASSVLLAVVGRNWVTAVDASGKRRLDDPGDLVRMETASALRKDIPVIPVLVGGATMPRESDLPSDLRDLVFRDGVELTHARWDADVKLLGDALEPLVPPKPPPSPWREGAVRAAKVLGVCAVLGGVVVAGFKIIDRTGSAGPAVNEPQAAPKPVKPPLADGAAAAKAAAERAAAKKAADERAAAEKLAADQAAAEIARAEKAAADQLAAEVAAAKKAAAKKAAADKAVADKLVADKAAADKGLADAAAAERQAAVERANAGKAREDLRRATTVQIRRGDSAKLDDLLRWMASVKDFKLVALTIVGHTDNSQSDAVSLRASVQRAEAVKAYLASHGADSARIYPAGRGSTQPIADNATPAGRAANNRATVEVSATGTSANGKTEGRSFSTEIRFE